MVRYYIYNVKRYLWLKTETVLRCHVRFWKAVRELDFYTQNWFGHLRGSQRWQNDTHKASQRVGTTDILRDKGRWLGIDPSSFYCEQRPSSVSQWNSFPPINSVAPNPGNSGIMRVKAAKWIRTITEGTRATHTPDKYEMRPYFQGTLVTKTHTFTGETWGGQRR